MKEYRHLFGPVFSRRLGRSLGVDLTPLKTCSFNCLYCQLGPTARVTLDRRAYVPLHEVLGELDDWRGSGDVADYVTLAGSGEPTLHEGFGEVILHARDRLGVATALLTNGSLFPAPDVRGGALPADVVKVTLSAWDQASFERLHRPHPDVRFVDVLDGIRCFREAFTGALWVEVFLVAGLNDGDEDIGRLERCLDAVGPDRVHVNTAVRPAAEGWVGAVSEERLRVLAERLGPRAEVVVPGVVSGGGAGWDTGRALEILRRHPCTVRQLAELFGEEEAVVADELAPALRAGTVRREERADGVYLRFSRAD